MGKNIKLDNIYSFNGHYKIDWRIYAQDYPNKTEAIKNLRMDTKLGLKEAKEVVEEIFRRVENGEVDMSKSCSEGHRMSSADKSKSLDRAKKAAKTAGKVAGVTAAGTAYVGGGVIYKLMKKYMK